MNLKFLAFLMILLLSLSVFSLGQGIQLKKDFASKKLLSVESKQFSKSKLNILLTNSNEMKFRQRIDELLTGLKTQELQVYPQTDYRNPLISQAYFSPGNSFEVMEWPYGALSFHSADPQHTSVGLSGFEGACPGSDWECYSQPYSQGFHHGALIYSTDGIYWAIADHAGTYVIPSFWGSGYLRFAVNDGNPSDNAQGFEPGTGLYRNGLDCTPDFAWVEKPIFS